MTDVTRRTALKTLGTAGAVALAGVGTGTGSASARMGASADPSLVELAVAANEDSGEFDVLIAALAANPELLDRLDGPGGQYTVFAPTDDAFGALGFASDNADTIPAAILANHVTRGRRYADSVTAAPQVRTLTGETITQAGGTLNDGQADIVATDLEAANGVLHVVDGVLLP